MILKRSMTHNHISKILENYSAEQIKDKIYHRTLQQSDLDEIRLQHTEWFPLSYPDDFYEKILFKPSVIAIGCFIDLEDFKDADIVTKLENLNIDEIGQKSENEIMIGSIISRVKIGNDDIMEI